MRRTLRFAILILSVLWAATALRPARAQFVDVTPQSGINYLQRVSGGISDLGFDAQILSGGAAAGDYDGDGFVDLFVTRLDAPSILYRNQGDGTFASVSNASTGLNVPSFSNGGSWGDIDNDGDLDLYATTVKQPSTGPTRNYLFVNNGNGTFNEVAQARNVDVSAGTGGGNFSSTFGDYDGDGYLDMYTTAWHDNGGLATRLFRNEGAANPGSFVDATVAAGVEMDNVPPTGTFFPPGNSFGFTPRFSDMNSDGLPDLAITGDYKTSRLFWNNGDGTFRDGTVAAGVGTDENGMGSTIADFNGDGNLDWFVTSIYDTQSLGWGSTGNRLYMNNGDETFTDATTASGVREGGWGWGTSALDYDNDGHMDLVMTNGYPSDLIQGQIPFPITDFSIDPMRLWNNNGDGTFQELAQLAGLTDTGEGKGLLTFDYDNDGDLDIFVVNNSGTPVLYRNDSSGLNDWLQVSLVGSLSNSQGIGAWITVTPELGGPEMVWEVNAGSNFLGQNDIRAHFGLGDLDGLIHQITINWPSGTTQTFHDVAPDQWLLINELSGIVGVPEPGTLVLLLVGGAGFGVWTLRRKQGTRLSLRAGLSQPPQLN